MASKYSCSNKLDSVILDKYATNLSGKAYDRVSEETISGLTLAKALELAIKYEKVVATAEHVDFVANKNGQKGNNHSKFVRKGEPKSNANGTENGKRERCKRCGYKNHVASECKFSNSKCHKCGITEHIASVCKQPKEKVNMVGNDNNDVVTVSDRFQQQLFALKSSNGDQPIFADVSIENISHRFILDSGNSVSLVDMDTFGEKFSHLLVKNDEFNVYAYNGERIDVTGYLEPVVKFENRRHQMKILIVNGAGQPILGRDFMNKFWIGFKQVNEILCVDTQLKGLLEQHCELFDGNLGKYRHARIHLNLKSNAVPVYYKAT